MFSRNWVNSTKLMDMFGGCFEVVKHVATGGRAALPALPLGCCWCRWISLNYIYPCLTIISYSIFILGSINSGLFIIASLCMRRRGSGERLPIWRTSLSRRWFVGTNPLTDPSYTPQSTAGTAADGAAIDGWTCSSGAVLIVFTLAASVAGVVIKSLIHRGYLRTP